jgi:hypothetical protein
MASKGGSKILMRQGALLAVILMAGFSAAGQANGSRHSVTVTFDYNFGLTPTCSEKVTEKCVKQFNVYDISAGRRNARGCLQFPWTLPQKEK